jgi:hypothetical protein
MIALKLLQAGGTGLFSGFAWPLATPDAFGPWVEVEPPLQPSLRGIHAVRATSVLDWLDEELWVIELAGEIIEADPLLVASRARLRRRVVGWDAEAATALAQSCLSSLREAADGATGETAVALQAVVADCVLLVEGGRPESSPRLPGEDRPTTPAAIAANLTYIASAVLGPAERARQQMWLDRRVDLMVGMP